VGETGGGKSSVAEHLYYFLTNSTIKTRFGTDEDIPVYDREENKLFWISVKSVSRAIKDPIGQMPPNYKGWMCGEVESKQWVEPPAFIIWYCLKTNTAWGGGQKPHLVQAQNG
jgi:hypothetical protein